VEHEDDFDRLTERLDPYHEFLRYGWLTDVVADPDEWRAEIRRQARLDGIRMHSMTLSELPDGRFHVWASIRRAPTTDEMRDAMLLMDAQREAEERATLLGHESIGWLRAARGIEAAGRCKTCRGRVYVRRADPPILDGDVFDEECR
jgi:hypothetical protein